tara:strand:+ start:894 stop:1313 length:420 start_codon:yes stop_codon:yes gene_type:complete
VIAATCLALALYHEARGESKVGQLMVARVIVNRVESKRFPDDVCSVIAQPRQFSFVRNGLVPIPRDEKSWSKSISLAYQVLEKPDILPYSNVDHFHTVKVRPIWRKKLYRITRVGQHIFYSYEKPVALITSLIPKLRRD